MSDSAYPFVQSIMFTQGGCSSSFCDQADFNVRCLSLPNQCPKDYQPNHDTAENAAPSFTPQVQEQRSNASTRGCWDGFCNEDHFGCCNTHFDAESSVFEEKRETTGAGGGDDDGVYNIGARCLYDYDQIVPGSEILGYGTVVGEDNMKDHVLNVGPLSIYLYTGGERGWLQSYTSGIYQGNAGAGGCSAAVGHPIDHAMQLVGYGTEQNINFAVDYWIIRNSWGTSNGVPEFVHIQRGINLCNISFWPAAYPKHALAPVK
jgi:hypothetical protein